MNISFLFISSSSLLFLLWYFNHFFFNWPLMSFSLSWHKDICQKEDCYLGGAAIAPLCRLRIPSCSPGFKSHAHYLCCFQFVLELILEWDSDKNEKRTKKRKRRRNCPIFFKKIVICELCSVVGTKSLNPPMSYFKQRNL